MRRPWQIWLLFGLGLAVVVPTMAWLTVMALQLDRADALARQQAEQEEDVSRALWRMDILLTPLLAEEAARPDFVYRPVYEIESGEGKVGGKGQATPQQELSPLLKETPPLVLLHFVVHPDCSVTSPQNPTGKFNAWALDNGASPETIKSAAARLEDLRPALDREALLALLPQQALPTVAWFDHRVPPGEAAPQSANTVITNTYDDLNQQLAQQALAPNSAESSYLFNPPAQGLPQPQPPAQEQRDAVQSQEEQALENSGLQQSAEQGQQAGDPYSQQLSYGNNVESGRSQRAQSRSGNDLNNRSSALQAFAQRSYSEQRSNYRNPYQPTRVVEGVSRPLWLGDRLVLARRVQIGEETIIQGCWLDWPAIRQQLKAEVADLLPEVEFVPLTAAEPIKLSRLLATIPVQLAVPAPVAAPSPWSPIRLSLIAAWSCLLLAAVAGAITLQSVLTLSERRGAFVSAVTHELRTPLTTFRMYAEMLAEGMVPDAEQRQKYLNTLRVEADRLSHLVENVLQYARLERTKSGRRREPVTLATLVEHSQSRLADRAEQGELKLVLEWDESVGATTINTDLAAVEQILFNLVDNACKYASGASDKRLHMLLAVKPRAVTITVRDHGPGIAAAGRKRLFQPFSKSVHEAANSAPGVGLGLALSRRLAIDLGGKLELQSPPDGGAAFVLTLPK